MKLTLQDKSIKGFIINPFLFQLLLLSGFLCLNTFSVKGGEFVIMNGQVTYGANGNAFSNTIKNYSNYPANWLSPDDYYHGTVYAYYKVLSVPTNVPFAMQICFFQYYPSKAAFDGINYNEVCSPATTLQGVNSEKYYSGTPNSWWKMGGRDADFARVYDFESVGPVLWGSNPYAPLIFTSGGGDDATWAQRANWLPCTIKVIIVAVSAGSTFSGWSNYLGGTPPAPPTPSYTINYTTEKTNQVIPSTDEYSYSAGMSPVISGTGTELTLTPGQDVYFRTKANGSTPASAIQQLIVPSRPAAPTFVLDPATNKTTILVTSDYEYSNSADMSGAISGTNTFVSIPAGTSKYFRKKATAVAFKSNVQTLNAASPPPVTGGLISSWPLDNSGNDISGNNHNLTLFNGAAYSTDKLQGSYSLSLDGINDYASSDAINLGNEFTIMMWAKVNAASSIRTLIANAPSGDKVSGFKFMINTYGTTDRRIIFESGNGSSRLFSTTTAANVFTFGEWNHVALVVNRTTGVATIYYNGNDVTSVKDIHTAFNSNEVLRLGMMTNNLCVMGGLLDDVRVYGRVLSQSEIQAMMSGNAPAPLNPPTSLNATLAGNSAQLGWTDNSTTEGGFLVERSLNSLTGYSQIASLPANTTVYTDNGLSLSSTYYYRVRAYNTGGNSTYSNVASLTTGGNPPPAGDFIANWPLDNSGSDISGNNHNLTLVNGATYSTDKQRGTYSLSLDGINDYASSDAINLGNEFTIMMWAKVNAASNIRTLIANAPSGDKVSGFKFMINTYGTTDRRIIFESGNGSSRLFSTTTAANVFTFGEWNHVALVVNRTTGVATIYCNGNDVTSVKDIHTAFNSNEVLRLGMMTNNLCVMGGLLDDVRIYGRALSQNEIQGVMSTLKGTAESGTAPDKTVSFYPNPFLDELTLENTSAIRIQIIDIMGKTRIDINHPEDKLIHMNTQNLISGIYVLRVLNEDGSVQISKVIKSDIR